MIRLSRAALLVLVGLLLSACQVDAVLEVAMNEDGSGTVTVEVGLDAEALERIPNLAEQLRTEDLEEAGWTVTGPETTDDDITWFRASKPFADPDEGVSVVQEVTGPDGVLHQVDLSRDKSFGATDYEFSATADFSQGLDSFSDEQVTELFGGAPFGGNVVAIEQASGVPAEGQVTFTVRTDLPGSEARTFALDPSDPEPQPITATSTDPNWPARLLALAAVVLFLGAIAAFVAVRVRSRRRRRAVGRVSAISEAADDIEVAPAPAPPTRRLEVVVLDGQGVMLASGDSAVSMLTDFAHDHGSVVSAARVEDAYRDATLGRLDDAQLWDVLGVEGDPDELTDTFLVGHRITPGLRAFLERIAERDLRVVIVANEVEAFARKLRRAHKLGDLTADWVISSDVGARLPDPVVFETCLRITEVPAANCFFIGADLEMLEAARAAGMAAAWFRPDVPEGEGEDESTFPVIRSFEDLGIGA